MKERGSSGVANEAGKSMRYWGWDAVAIVDALLCPYCHKLIYPKAAPGTFDFRVQIPLWNERRLLDMAVEVKAGNTRFDFAKFRPEQHEWAANSLLEEPLRELWLWLCIGKSITHKKYPRRTYLIPYLDYRDIEEQIERKSIPHGHPALDRFELVWMGSGLWGVPPEHPASCLTSP